jgi:hypothetical protein
LKAYSSSKKEKLHFPRPVNTFHDPLDLIFYQIRPSTNMDVQNPGMLFLNNFEDTKGEIK